MLPRLILVADRFTDRAIGERVMEAAAGGAPWIMLRDRQAEGDVFAHAAEMAVGRLRAIERAPLVSITARLEIAHALQTNLHLGRNDVSVADAVRALDAGALVGYSAHDAEEARKAVDAGAAYIVFSPVFATSSKPGAMGVGVDAITRLIDVVPEVPVFALGGITPARTRSCLKAGAHGIAVASGILEQADPALAVARYLREVSRRSP